MVDRADDEDLQKLKDWWRDNGPAVVTGLALAAATVAGWWGYTTWQERGAQQAAMAYTELMRAEQQDAGLEAVVAAGREVMEEHAGSGYAAMAALRTARVQMEAEAFREAAQTLGWLVENADERAMRELARLRQARALGEVAPEEALALLEAEASEGFAGAYAELRGDLLRELDRPEEAVAAYREALEAPVLRAQSRELVELKLQAAESEA